ASHHQGIDFFNNYRHDSQTAFSIGRKRSLVPGRGPDSRVHERQPVTVRQESLGRQESLPPAAISRAARWVIVALSLYAVATPLLVAGIVALKLVPVPSPDFIMIGLGLALFGPGLAAITVALRGLNAVVRDLTIRPDTEPQQAIIRLFIAGAVLAYLAGLAYLGKGGDTILPLLAVDVPGVLTAWLLLVH